MKRYMAMLVVLVGLLMGAAAQAQQSIARVLFENLALTDGTPIANHTGFSKRGLDQPEGFNYSVNNSGTLKYVTAPLGGGALFPGYRRSSDTFRLGITRGGERFQPLDMTFSNPFYLQGGFAIQLVGREAGVQVWSQEFTLGDAETWQNLQIDTGDAPPMDLLLVRAVAPSQLYLYLEGWTYANVFDADDDGVTDSEDLCPDTPPGTTVNADGCPDADGDGVQDADDQCVDTPVNESVNADGCGSSQLDDDSDGISNAADLCPGTPLGAAVNGSGCAQAQLDSDSDGINNALDQCPGTAANQVVDAQGCSSSQLDANGNGIEDSIEAAVLLIILNNNTVED